MRRLTVLIVSLFLLTFSIAKADKEANPAKPMKSLYVFAHEDDEINVAAKIFTDVQAGREVYCAWVTDGGRAGAPEVRQQESRAVMDLLGVPPDHLFFLGYPDQGAYKHLDEIVNQLDKLVKQIGPSDIMSHAYEGSNIDHDVVSFVSTMAAVKLNIVHYEFPDTNVYKGRMYVWRFLPHGGAVTLYTPLDKDLYSLKMKTMKMYPSQAQGLNAYELAVDKAQLRKHGEPYRAAPDYDYTKPPADELRYGSTSKGTATIEMWLDAAKDYLKRHKK